MASILSAIATQLITDIETTSIVKCYFGSAENAVDYPRAELYMDSGQIDNNVTSVIDLNMGFTVDIYGQSWEQTQLACEEIMKLWYSAAKRLVLAGLGVVNILPVSPYPALVYAPSSSTTATTQRPVMGALTFEMTVRYTY